MIHLDLFSGIGGFALAARWAGIETIQFVEIDPFCQKVLAKNFPGVSIHDDIKTFTYASPIKNDERERGNMGNQTEGGEGGNAPAIIGNQYGQRPFLLTGGFPCQPFSCAGKRRGKEDDRYLWPEMLRVISEAKPTWIIGENVAGFINMGLDECISDLEGEGYEVQPFVIPACAVNAPHRRDRVWIVANARNGSRRERGICGQGEIGKADRKRTPDSLMQSDCHAPDTNGFNGDDTRHGSGQVSQLQKAEIFRGTLKDSPIIGCGSRRPESKGFIGGGGIAGASSAWNEPWIEAATRLCRVDDGLPRQVDRVKRLKALGNSIVPQVAFEIMKVIVKGERCPY